MFATARRRSRTEIEFDALDFIDIFKKYILPGWYPMMGAAMLKRHQFVLSLWALYRLVVSSITFVRHLYVGESGAALVPYQLNISVRHDSHTVNNCQSTVLASLIFIMFPSDWLVLIMRQSSRLLL